MKQLFAVLLVLSVFLVGELAYHRAWARPEEENPFFIHSDPAHCDYQSGVFTCETKNEVCTYIGRGLKCEPRQ